MMRKYLLLFCLTFSLLFLASCNFESDSDEKSTDKINATEHGLSVENSGEENSKALQALVDKVSISGGVIYIPAGEYLFCENGRQTIGSHCIKMKSNVSIVGDGDKTVLCPIGNSEYGMDMFYYNDYLDLGEPSYLENCNFQDFVIDAAGSSCNVYTSAGKGFMFNLFKNCHWQRVTVKNTDATGFGVDCPTNGSIKECIAIGCGKAATEENGGASGFGIGFGYCDDESIIISGCTAQNNKKFGFFLEHQGRFSDERYSAEKSLTFRISDCISSGNLFNFGGICAMNTVYERCRSFGAEKYGFYFENSTSSEVLESESDGEGQAAFAILHSDKDGNIPSSGIKFVSSSAKNSPVGVKIVGLAEASLMFDNLIDGCDLGNSPTAVYTEGKMRSLTLKNNFSQTNNIELFAKTEELSDFDNSWN